MDLTDDNLKIMKHVKGHTLQIIMPDGSGNYLHLQLYNDVNSMALIRDLLIEQSIYIQDIEIKEDETYYRLHVTLKDCNDDIYQFHSRKLNLNDAVYERMQLIK